MSFVAPLSLLLFMPLCGLLVLLRFHGTVGVGRLPGRWHHVVASGLHGYLAERSNLGQAGWPVLCLAIAVPVIVALAQPGIDTRDHDAVGQLRARVIILDVGADLARHRQFVDTLMRTDQGVATSVIAVADDAYRIVPFTTDHAQLDRYVRVLNADMMPRPGQKPHVALADAERSLANAGFPARQIVLLSARRAPDQIVEIPPRQSNRYVVMLGSENGWEQWADAQDAVLMREGSAIELTEALRKQANKIAQTEIPTARHDFTVWLIALAAFLWLMLFRRRSP